MSVPVYAIGIAALAITAITGVVAYVVYRKRCRDSGGSVSTETSIRGRSPVDG